jgi:ribosomal protein S18 acetylase RimI-like enzyme
MANEVGALQIVPFTHEDQVPVRALILEGLAERWGSEADPTLNPDLDDIAGSYPRGTTLIARLDNLLVGTGTVVPRELHVEEVVRMSVAPAARGSGIGSHLLGKLVDAASARGARRIVCETCAHWESAVRLYVAFGFTITHYRDGDFCRDAHFALDLR